VFHLAAVSSIPDAGADPGTAWSTNVMAAVSLLDAVALRKASGTLDPVVVIAGSGEEYGAHPASEQPLSETAELRPASLYASTKVAQELAALAAWRALGVKVIATRPFNHSGPGQAPTFLLPSLVRRALNAQDAGDDTIRVGNTEPVRDFLNVSDVARAYLFLALRGRPGEVYNIASGIGTSVGDLAAMVLKQVRHDARVVSDPALVRPVDVPALIGNPAKLTADTTWRPKADLEMLIDDLIDAATH
jgi:GDP-4-dehydro-6-deoxy-D-mannose reductase